MKTTNKILLLNNNNQVEINNNEKLVSDFNDGARLLFMPQFAF